MNLLYIIPFPTLFKSVTESLLIPSNNNRINNDDDENEKDSIMLAPIKPVPPPKIVNIEGEEVKQQQQEQESMNRNQIKSPRKRGSVINNNKECLKVTQFKVLDMNHYICGLKVLLYLFIYLLNRMVN